MKTNTISRSEFKRLKEIIFWANFIREFADDNDCMLEDAYYAWLDNENPRHYLNYMVAKELRAQEVSL